MVLRGRKGEDEEEETRGEKNGAAERLGEWGEGKDAGWQADGCPVYWFIRWFSHDVPSSHETSRRFSLCVREYQVTRLRLLFLLKMHPRATCSRCIGKDIKAILAATCERVETYR